MVPDALDRVIGDLADISEITRITIPEHIGGTRSPTWVRALCDGPPGPVIASRAAGFGAGSRGLRGLRRRYSAPPPGASKAGL